MNLFFSPDFSLLALSSLVNMNSPVTIALLASIPIYLIMVVGWVSRRVNWVTPDMDKGFMKIAIELCYPCFILDRMLGNELLRSPAYSLKAAGVGAGICLCSILLCLGFARLLRLKKGQGARTFAISSAVQNYSFFIIPIVAILYGGPNDPTMGVLFTHNVGFEFTLWTVGLMVMSEATKFSPALLLRGPIIAVMLGLFLVWTRLDSVLVPMPIRSTLQMLGACAVPLSLFLVGTTLYDLLGKFKWSLKISLGGVAARCLILPVFILAVAWLLPVDPVLKRVLIFQAAVPSAILPIIIARHFGGQPAVAVEIVVCTTIASFVALPVWLSVGFKFIPH